MIETASWSRRIGALAIDWIACTLLIAGVVPGALDPGNPAAFLVHVAFVVESAFLIALVGGSFGQIVTGLRVVRYDGAPRPITLLPAVLRQVLIVLVIPPLVFRPDGRGLHDMAVKSAVVRLDDLRG